MKRRTKIVLIITIIAIVALFIVVGIVNLCRSATLSILVTPLDATISINGKKYTNGTYRFFPGEVSIKIEREELDAKEYNLELKPFATTLLHDYLTKDGDFSYYIDHADDYEALKFVYDDEALDFVKRQEKINSIAEILPLRISKYASIYLFNTIVENASAESWCTRVVCLKVRADLDGGIISGEVLGEYGYNLDDYMVTYEPE